MTSSACRAQYNIKERRRARWAMGKEKEGRGGSAALFLELLFDVIVEREGHALLRTNLLLHHHLWKEKKTSPRKNRLG